MSKIALKSLELRHPFFVPIWRRILLVLILGFWTMLEGLMGNQIWTLFVAGIGVYSIYVFFFNFVLPEDTVIRETDT